MIDQFYSLVRDAIKRYPKSYDRDGALIGTYIPNTFAVLNDWEDIKKSDLGKSYKDVDVYHFYSRSWERKKFPQNIHFSYPMVYVLELGSVINVKDRTMQQEIEIGVLIKGGKEYNTWELFRSSSNVIYNIFRYICEVSYYSNDSSGLWLLPHETGVAEEYQLKKDHQRSNYFTPLLSGDVTINNGTINGVDHLYISSTNLTISMDCLPLPQWEEEECHELKPNECCA